MFYPRNKVEMSAVRLFFQSSEEESGNNFLPDTEIHVGYRVRRPIRDIFSPTFVSVDEKKNMTMAENKDLFVRFAEPEMNIFNLGESGPVLCAPNLAYLKSCLPRLLRRYTVCTLDFL